MLNIEIQIKTESKNAAHKYLYVVVVLDAVIMIMQDISRVKSIYKGNRY